MNDLDYFENQWVAVDKPEDFLFSRPAKFFRQMFGELIYTEENTTNFINVHKFQDKYIMSDGIYAEQFPHHKKIGTVLPKDMFVRYPQNYTGGHTTVGEMLAKKGFAIIPWGNEYDMIYDNLEQGEWYLHDKDHEGGISDMANEYFKFEDVKTESLPSVVSTFSKNQDVILRRAVRGNHFLENKTTEVIVQRMTEGQGVPRHYDSDVNGEFVLAVAAINWFTKDEFAGRELVGGIRSLGDLEEWLRYASTQKGKKHYQEKAPNKYTDFFTLKPQSGITVLVNSINPHFQHGVNILYAGNPIYSIIHQLVASGRSPHYTYLYEGH